MASTPVLRGLRAAVLPLALLLGLLLAVAVPQTASACTCQGLGARSALSRADAVFQGRVVANDTVRHPAPGRLDIRFAVSRVYKGTVYAEQVVASPRSADGCGVDPAVGSSLVVFAEERVEGSGDRAVIRLVTQLCSGNQPGEGDPVLLGAGRAPLAGASDREERADSTDATVTRALRVGGIALLSLLALGAAGLAVLWRPRRQG